MINKKRTGFIVLGLAALSLGTIGFSSWIINGITGGASSEVNVTVGDVEDRRLTIDNLIKTDTDLSFDVAPKTVGGGVIEAGDVVGAKEDLSFTFSFDLWGTSQTNFEAAISGKGFKVSFTSTELSSLVTSKAICSPITINGAKHHEEAITTFAAAKDQTDNYETGEGDTSAVRLKYSMTKIDGSGTGKYGFNVSMTYSFTWGEAFDYENPVKLEAIDGDAKTALDALKALNETESMILNVSLSLETIA